MGSHDYCHVSSRRVFTDKNACCYSYPVAIYRLQFKEKMKLIDSKNDEITSSKKLITKLKILQQEKEASYE